MSISEVPFDSQSLKDSIRKKPPTMASKGSHLGGEYIDLGRTGVHYQRVGRFVPGGEREGRSERRA